VTGWEKSKFNKALKKIALLLSVIGIVPNTKYQQKDKEKSKQGVTSKKVVLCPHSGARNIVMIERKEAIYFMCLRCYMRIVLGIKWS